MQPVLRHHIEPEALSQETFLGRELEVAPWGERLDAMHEGVPLELELVGMIPELQDLPLDPLCIELCGVGHWTLFLRTPFEEIQRFTTWFRGVRERSDVVCEGDDLEAPELLQVL